MTALTSQLLIKWTEVHSQVGENKLSYPLNRGLLSAASLAWSQALRNSQRCASLKFWGMGVGLLFSNGGPRSATPAPPPARNAHSQSATPGKSGFTVKAENHVQG